MQSFNENQTFFTHFSIYIGVEEESSVTEAEFSGTFGIPLYACAFSEELMIPYVVEICTKIVEERGLENQGIYRVPGNTGAVNALQAELDKEPYNVDTDNDKWLDVNVVSSLLKLFFRKLPESLISDDLYETMMSANRTEDPEKRMLRIKRVLHELPDINFETFRYMACHLNKVIESLETNLSQNGFLGVSKLIFFFFFDPKCICMLR